MREYIVRNKSSFIILLLIAAVVSVPLMTDYVLVGDSTAVSLARIENIYKSVGNVFPIRIGTLDSSVYGYSATAFQADLFYAVPVFFRLVGISLGGSFRLTLFIFNILTVFIAFFSLRKCFGDDRLGLLAGMLYTWCPYRITSMYTSGNLSEVFAWSFIPIIITGLWEIYGESAEQSRLRDAGIKLIWGFSLISLSSTVFLFVMAAMSVLLFFIMWRKSFRRPVLIELVKTVIGVVCINAWFIIPMLLRMRKPEAVGVMIAGDMRGLGMYFAQYLTIFNFGGGDTQIWADGMQNAPAYGPGAAVLLLVFAELWLIFTGGLHCENKPDSADKKGGEGFYTAVCIAGAVFIFISTCSFPWDMLQNKNMLFSIMLAMMESPARWGIAADVCMIIIACRAMRVLKEKYGDRVQMWLMVAAASAAFGCTQFLLGNIMTSRGFVWDEDIEAFGNIELPVINSESVLWRLCEIVSLFSICVCVVIWLMGRRKSAEKI